MIPNLFLFFYLPANDLHVLIKSILPRLEKIIAMCMREPIYILSLRDPSLLPVVFIACGLYSSIRSYTAIHKNVTHN